MLISKFEKAGVNLNGLKKELDSEILKDKTFVITGSFDNSLNLFNLSISP